MKRNLPHLTYKGANFVRLYNNVSCKLSKDHHLLGVIYASQKLGRAPNMNIKRLYLQYCINSLCRNYRSAMPVITDFFIDSFLLTVFLIRNFRDTNF